MSMLNCLTCGKKVAEDASTCPHCGTSDPTLNNWGKFFFGKSSTSNWIIMFVIGFCIWGYFNMEKIESFIRRLDQSY